MAKIFFKILRPRGFQIADLFVHGPSSSALAELSVTQRYLAELKTNGQTSHPHYTVKGLHVDTTVQNDPQWWRLLNFYFTLAPGLQMKPILEDARILTKRYKGRPSNFY